MQEGIAPKYKKSTIIQKGITKASDKSTHYVDRAAFYNALVERRGLLLASVENGTEPPRVTDFIGKCLLDIATGLTKKWQFSQYSWKDDFIGEAVIHCIRYIDSFDPEKSTNPFSYFTQACYYQFLAIIEAEGLETYVKFVAMMGSAALNEVAENSNEINEEFEIDLSELDMSYIESFVGTYQQKIIDRAKGKKSPSKKGRKMKKPSLDDIADELITEITPDGDIIEGILREIEGDGEQDTTKPLNG